MEDSGKMADRHGSQVYYLERLKLWLLGSRLGKKRSNSLGEKEGLPGKKVSQGL